MSAIVIVTGNLNPSGSEDLKTYQAAAGPTVVKHGGQVIFRGKGAITLAGSRSWQVALAIRFPDEAAVRAWYDDPEYQKVLSFRAKAFSELEIFVINE